MAFEACGAMRTPWVRLYVYLTDKIKSGDKLDGQEREWLRGFLDERGYGHFDEKDVLTVQIVRRDVARDLFKGSPQSVSRALDGLADHGLAQLVRAGTKGHGSLYIVGFLGSHPAVSHVTQSDRVTDRSGECDPIGSNGVTNPAGLGHKNCGLGHKNGRMGSHSKPPTRGDDAISRVIHSKQNNPPDKSAATCPECGGELAFERGAYECVSCGRVCMVASRGKGRIE